MARFLLTWRAAADFDDIVAFTRDRWGERQAARYASGLDQCFHRIATNQTLGRSCDEVAPGVRRVEQASHVVFFRPVVDGVLVIRILHRRMLPERHLGDKGNE